MSTAARPTLSLRALNELTPRSYSWLWHHRLALGKLALLDGDPEQGKSLLTADLCARLTSGRPFPGDDTSLGPANVIIMNSEDNADDTLLPRIRAMGGDTARVFLTHQRTNQWDELLRFPMHADLLDEALTRTRALLAIIDPITAFLDQSVHTASDQSVRRALLPLGQLADRHGCAFNLVRHLNKRGGARAIYRGSASIAFSAACRSDWLVAHDPKAPARRVLAQIKNNLAPPQPSLAFEVLAGPDDQPALNWLGPTAWTADQLLASLGQKPPRVTRRSRARDFLAVLLADGPRLSRDIWNAAQPQGFSARTLQRAREDLAARCVRTMVDGKLLSYWLLPGHELPAAAAPNPATDLEPWLAPLRELYPPRNPLDDPP